MRYYCHDCKRECSVIEETEKVKSEAHGTSLWLPITYLICEQCGGINLDLYRTRNYVEL